MRRSGWLMVMAAAMVLGLLACGNPTAQELLSTETVAPARLAEPGEVTGCRFLGEVQGYAEPSRSGNVPLARLTARDDLLQQAGNLGATHVVLVEYLGNRRAVAVGKAYQCK